MKLSTAEQNIIELISEEKDEAYRRGCKEITECSRCGDDVVYRGSKDVVCGHCAS